MAEIEDFISYLDNYHDYDDELVQEIRNLCVELNLREEHTYHV